MARETMRLPKTEQQHNRLKDLAKKVVELSAAMEKERDPQKKESLSLDLEIAQKEHEFFRWERDSTGAKKGDRFGVELAEELESMGLKRNESGEVDIEQSELLDRQHLVLVNMGELDRLNQQGEHALGDVGLELTYNKIQQTVAENLREFIDGEDVVEMLPDMFEIYRISGNEFGVMLKNVNEGIAKKITEQLQGKVEMPEGSGVEAAPLAANNISFRKSFELLRTLRSAYSFEEVSEIDKSDAEQDDRTLLISLLKERMFTMADFVKVRSRMERMVSKIKTGDADAEELYEKYLKKTLGGVFAEGASDEGLDYEAFVQALKERGAALETGEVNHPDWEKHLFIASRDASVSAFQSRFEMKRKSEVELQKQILSDVQDKAEEMKLEIEEGVPISHRERFAKEYGESEERAVVRFEEQRAKLGETEGRKLFAQLHGKLDKLNNANADERRVRLAELSLEVEKLKRDSATGLKGRGLLFGEMQESMEQKKPVSIISIDMAFLKLFDKEGGAKTGDAAILTSGMILDHVKRKYTDLGAEAYRVGGDEFVLKLDTDDKARVEQMIEDVRELARDMGEIPEYKGGTGRYTPEELQFNFGSMVYPNPEMPEIENPDKLVNAADAKVEADKAINRFVLLMQKEDRLRRVPQAERDKARVDMDVLYAYSAKAIFGNEGRDKIKEWAKEYASGGLSLKSIKQEMVEFISRGLKEKGKEDIAKMDLEYVLLRNDLVAEMQRAEIVKLMDELEQAKKKEETSREKIAGLQERLKAAQAEFDDIAKIRQELA
ncbi:diguanylate cyclase [Candidatus Uhrbacteria bacterium]|nr:diguanylate cyclase [Candidatus Uhrbacteria bacterium]